MADINEIIGALGAGLAAAGDAQLGAEILRQQATRREKQKKEADISGAAKALAKELGITQEEAASSIRAGTAGILSSQSQAKAGILSSESQAKASLGLRREEFEFRKEERTTKEEREQAVITARRMGMTGEKQLPANLAGDPVALGAFYDGQLQRESGLRELTGEIQSMTKDARLLMRDARDRRDIPGISAARATLENSISQRISGAAPIYGELPDLGHFDMIEDFGAEAGAAADEVAQKNALEVINRDGPITQEEWEGAVAMGPLLDHRPALKGEIKDALDGGRQRAQSIESMALSMNPADLAGIPRAQSFVKDVQAKEGKLDPGSLEYRNMMLDVAGEMPVWNATAEKEKPLREAREKTEAEVALLSKDIGLPGFAESIAGAKDAAELSNRATQYATSDAGRAELNALNEEDRLNVLRLTKGFPGFQRVLSEIEHRKYLQGNAEERRKASVAGVRSRLNVPSPAVIDTLISDANAQNRPVNLTDIVAQQRGTAATGSVSRQRAIANAQIDFDQRTESAERRMMNARGMGDEAGFNAAQRELTRIQAEEGLFIQRQSTVTALPYNRITQAILEGAADKDRVNEVVAQAFGLDTADAAVFDLGLGDSLKDKSYRDSIYAIRTAVESRLGESRGADGGQRTSGIDPVELDGFRITVDSAISEITAWSQHMPSRAGAVNLDGTPYKSTVGKIAEEDIPTYLAAMAWAGSSRLDPNINVDAAGADSAFGGPGKKVSGRRMSHAAASELLQKEREFRQIGDVRGLFRPTPGSIGSIGHEVPVQASPSDEEIAAKMRESFQSRFKR